MVLVFSDFVLLGTLVCYLKGSNDFQPVGLTKGTVVKFFVLCLLPVLSIVGTYVANVTGNNSILLLALLTVLAVFVVAVFSKRLIAPKLYLIIVLVIAITLLFQFSLTSNYLQGADIKVEYYLATLTQSNGSGMSTASFSNLVFGKFNSMLSVTVLPTIYSNILNMNIDLGFQDSLSFNFCACALRALFVVAREIWSFSGFLFSFSLYEPNYLLYELLGLARQMVAEVFFVLLFLVLFSKILNPRNATILFVIFSFCLIASHYSIAIIFAFFITLMWLLGSHFIQKPTSTSD